jgi:hypothetical protein
MRRALLLLITAMLLGAILICGGYGTLLHAQIIAPPVVYIQLGRYTVKSVFLQRHPCNARPACVPAEPEIQHAPMSYEVWLVIEDSVPMSRRRTIRLLRVPLAPP